MGMATAARKAVSGTSGGVESREARDEKSGVRHVSLRSLEPDTGFSLEGL